MRRLARISIAITIIGIVSASSALGADARVFRAGAATGDITPELGSMIIGGFSPTPAKDIHDPLHVRAMVLDDGTRRIAMVVCDNIGLPREVCDEAKRLTKERSGLDPSHVLISATHTHSATTAGTETSIGPSTGRGPADIAAYQKFVATRIADTIQCAIDRLEPARIGWGSAVEPGQVFNRRWHIGDEAQRRNPFGGVDAVRMNPPAASPTLEKPAGPTDPEISFISVQAKNGRPLALYAAYSLHYVGGVPSGVVSADYFGVFCEGIGELLDEDYRRLRGDRDAPPFVGLLANGTSGDVNNIDFKARRVAQPPFQQMRKVANVVATAVHRAYRTIEHRDWVPLDAVSEELTIGSRRPTPELVTWAKQLLASPDRAPRWHPRELTYANRVLQRAQAPETVAVTLQVMRVGDVAVMSLPVETFAEMGLELKAKSPFPKTFTVSMANGYLGYMPTVAQHRLGGYESWVGTNRVELEAAPKMTAALLRLAGELKGR